MNEPIPMTIDGELREDVVLMPVDYTEPVCMLTIFAHYWQEHCQPEGVDFGRLRTIATNICGFFGLDRDPQTLKRADISAYREHRLAEGVKDSTVRREFAFLKAAINHGKREERLEKVPHIAMPPLGQPRRRFLSEEECVRVMRQPMPYRIRMFFVIAFATAARAKAIEELSWDRIDWANGLIDFRVPGKTYKKKRRAIVPMSNDLRRRLEASFNRPGRDLSDPLVIGLGPRGKCSTTYHEAQKVMKAAGLWKKGFPPRHVARKTWASHAAQANISEKKMELVLWDTPLTIQKSYSFLRPSDAQEVVNFKQIVPSVIPAPVPVPPPPAAKVRVLTSFEAM